MDIRCCLRSWTSPASGKGTEGGEIRDVTVAVLRYSRARLRRSRGAKSNAEADQRERIRTDASYKPKTGSPTPERRKRALDEDSVMQLVPSPDAPSARLYQVPSHLERLHRNGRITATMLHAASRFHSDWVMAGLVGVRIAKLTRISGGGATDGLTGAVLDARDRIHKICDRLGGFNGPGFQALVGIVGELNTVVQWAQDERAGPWRLNHDSGRGVLICALAAAEGFYRSASNGQ